MVNVQPAPLSWRLLLIMACAVEAIAETFSTPITMLPELLTVRMPDTAVSAVSILRAATRREPRQVSGPLRQIRFNAATLIIGRGAADAALFRESVERKDRP